jgi:hypothetical protein
MRQTISHNQYCNCQARSNSKAAHRPAQQITSLLFYLTLSLLPFGAPNFAYADDAINIPDHIFQGSLVPTQPPDAPPPPSNPLTRLIARKKVREYPPIPSPNPNKLVPPPSEEIYFPVRKDGQPFMLNVDTTVNLTAALNDFYYDPKWRGEVWVPFDQVDTIERAARLMSTWPEYDQENIFRRFTGLSKFFEKYSGFGP